MLSDSLGWIYFRCKAGAVLAELSLLGVVFYSEDRYDRVGVCGLASYFLIIFTKKRVKLGCNQKISSQQR